MPTKLEAAARRAAIALGWTNPFFLLPIAALTYHDDVSGRHTKTAGITADGRVYLHPPFVARLSQGELQGLIAHETMHMLMQHFWRRGDRDPKIWNIAGDMAINYALKQSGIKLPDGAIYPPSEWEGWHTERIYAELMADSQARAKALSQVGDDGEGNPTPAAGCGVMPPSDEGSGASDGDGEGEEKGAGGQPRPSDAELQRRWRELSAQARESARQGEGRGNALVDALTIPESRVKWASILRRGVATAIAAHGYDKRTWKRRGRRSQAVGPQFAGWITNAAKVAIAIDTSGSMSDETLAQCVAEAASIAKASGVAIYLVTHDHGVQWEGWLSARAHPSAIQRALVGRGGTDASAAYRAVENAAKRFDAFVHLTDGFLYWPEWPTNVRKPIVALAGYHTDKGSVPQGALVVEVD